MYDIFFIVYDQCWSWPLSWSLAINDFITMINCCHWLLLWPNVVMQCRSDDNCCQFHHSPVAANDNLFDHQENVIVDLYHMIVMNAITGSSGGSRGGFFTLPSLRVASASSPFFWSCKSKDENDSNGKDIHCLQKVHLCLSLKPARTNVSELQGIVLSCLWDYIFAFLWSWQEKVCVWCN